MKIFPCSESCSGVTWRLNNSTPIACSSARMRRLNAGCETLRLMPPGKIAAFFQGQKIIKPFGFNIMQNRTTVIHYVLLVSRPCGHFTSIRAADNRLSRFKRSFHAGFAVFDHQFAASVYLLNAQFWRHDQQVSIIAWQNFAFPGQVKEPATLLVSGRRASLILKS